jgi:hypothetical protein
MQVTTDAAGQFRFSDMDPGYWDVGIVVPAGMEVLFPDNPLPVLVQQNTTLTLLFALADLPTPTPTATLTRTATPTSTRTATPTRTPTPTRRIYRDYVPLLMRQ